MNNQKNKKHILVVSQYFYPEQFRINDMCEEWVKRGHDVTVVTGIPNYPLGRFFKGYNWFCKRNETVNGVNIIRLPIVPRGSSKISLVLNYYSYVISGWFWAHFTGIKADTTFIYEVSPMTQALVGVWYSRRINIPCSIYVQDLWPENLVAIAGITNRFIIKNVEKTVDKIYRDCKKIYATSRSFKEHLELRESTLDYDGNSKVFFWPQYAEEFYCPISRENTPKEISTNIPDSIKCDSCIKIAFTGNIGYAQGLDILPKTAQILKNNNRIVLFVIIGSGRYMKSLQQEISETGVDEYFIFMDRQDPQNIPNYLAYCDAGFVSFNDNPIFSKTIPAKLQSYMACGKMVVAAANGETRRIIEESNSGVCVDAGNAEDLAAEIEKLIANKELINKMGENAYEYSIKFFSKKKLMDEIEDDFILNNEK